MQNLASETSDFRRTSFKRTSMEFATPTPKLKISGVGVKIDSDVLNCA